MICKTDLAQVKLSVLAHMELCHCADNNNVLSGEE